MIKFLSIFFLLIIFILAIPVTTALSTDDLEFDKMPLSPGETTDMYITITNYGSEKKDISVILVHQGNATSHLASSSSAEAIGILDGSAGIRNLPTGKSEKVKFTIFTSSVAEEGIYNLDVIARYKDADALGDGANASFIQETLTTVSIQVVKALPNVIIESVSDTVMSPGSDKSINLKVRNIGSETAKNVILEIMPTQGGAESPLVFTVVDSTSRFVLGDMGSNSSTTVGLKLSTDVDAGSGTYKLPVSIYTQNSDIATQYISLTVIPKAELTVLGVSTSPETVQPGKRGMLIVSIKNLGKSTAEQVRVELGDNEYLDRTSVVYMGSVKSEEEGSAIFDLTVREGAAESFPITIRITYQDGFGENSVVEDYTIVTGDSVISGTRRFSTFDYIPILILLLTIPISIIIILAGWRKKRGYVIDDYGKLDIDVPKADATERKSQIHTSKDQDWFSKMMDDKKPKKP